MPISPKPNSIIIHVAGSGTGAIKLLLVMISIHLLIGFSFKLALKAAYMSLGGDSEMLTRFNHDLTKTLQAARKRGFAFGDKRLGMLIDALRNTHADHYFRYGTAPTVLLPTFQETLPMLQELVVDVCREGKARMIITNGSITQ